LRELSKLYTQPSNDPSVPKLHAYSLRGVSISKSTMYICRRAEPDLIDMDMDGDGQKENSDQWWRIHYAPIGSSPVTVEVSRSFDLSFTLSCDSNALRKRRWIRFLKPRKTRSEVQSLCMRASMQWKWERLHYQRLWKYV